MNIKQLCVEIASKFNVSGTREYTKNNTNMMKEQRKRIIATKRTQLIVSVI